MSGQVAIALAKLCRNQTEQAAALAALQASAEQMARRFADLAAELAAVKSSMEDDGR